MTILIVAATQLELNKFYQLLEAGETLHENSSVHYNGHQISVLISGIGLVAATFALTRKLESKKYDLVINAGICGSFNRSIKLGEVVHIISDRFGDIGVQDDESFLSLADIGLQDDNLFPYTGGKLSFDYGSFRSLSLQGLREVNAISVNTAHGNEKAIARTLLKFAADVESMEGAAVAFVCLHLKQPFLQIRAVSNYVEKRDRSKWNIPLALDNLSHQLLKIIADLP